jgi:CRISPR/Cas system-associated exonuclease Cas4 (RecB family)
LTTVKSYDTLFTFSDYWRAGDFGLWSALFAGKGEGMKQPKIPTERVSFLKPLLTDVVSRQSKRWPTYDGNTLDRGKFVTSSEIGKCARMVKYGKVLEPVEGFGKYGWGFAQRGHSVEAWVVQQLHNIPGHEFQFGGEKQVSFYDGAQAGTPDHVLSVDGDVWVIDYKSIDPRTNISNLPKPEHVSQVIQNMDLVEACLDVDTKGGLLVYINASDFSEIYEYVIDRNSPNVGEHMVYLERRAKSIIEAESPDDLEPEGLYNGQCKTCVFTDHCSAALTNAKQEKANAEKIIRAGSAVFGQHKA